jgi:hypothetical protein
MTDTYRLLVTFDRRLPLDRGGAIWVEGRTIRHVDQAHADRWLDGVARNGFELRNVVITRTGSSK